MSKDYIPRNAAEFDVFFKNLNQYVGAHKTAWSHVTEAAHTGLLTAYTDWYTAFALTIKPHTPVETLGRQQAYAAATKALRAFVNQYLRFPPVTDLDRRAMGIPNHDTIRTPHTEVAEVVEFEIKLRNIREILVHFWIKGSSNKAKPEGYDGAVLVWDILDAPPAHVNDLSRHTMASRTPHAIEFDENERGKTVYIAASWQNERGNIGKWSEVQSASIP